MSQHDFVIDNSTGQAVRLDMNAALQALVSLSAGPVEPAVKYAYQLWYNTSLAKLMQRNGGNNAWVDFASTVQAGGLAPLASPAFTGNPTAPTAPANDSDTSIANTAWVQAEIAGFAPKASPAFTGTVTAPTPAVGTNSTVVATTAFVKAQGYLAGGDVPTNSRMYARSDSAWAIMAALSMQLVHRVYASSSTWTKPAAANFVGIWLEMQGAGGGGGGCKANPAGWTSAGGGGGAGAYMRQWIPAASCPASAAVTIGAAGAGGVPTSVGADGGNTVVSTFQCSGGAGGSNVQYTGSGPSYGGVGGISTGWNYVGYGEKGGMGVTWAHGISISIGGGGGNSLWGSGGYEYYTSAYPGDPAEGYGAGGGGALSGSGYGAQSGGQGRSGIVRITEYYGPY